MKIFRTKIRAIFLITFLMLVVLIPWNGDYFFNKTSADDNQTVYEEKIVWSLSSAPVSIDGETHIFQSGLEIEAGVKIFLKNGARIIVEGGNLEVLGSVDHPVTFEGVEDFGANFTVSANGLDEVYINNAVFSKGGYNQCSVGSNFQENFFKKSLAYYIGDCLVNGALNINNSSNISINNTVFNDNYKAVNIINSEGALLTNNSFYHNQIMAVHSETENPVIAKSNCWMRPSGPTYEGNPNGKGERISGDFDLDFRECGSEFKPVILIPGIGGSWNWTEMFSENSLDDWDFTPFLNAYDAWEDSLKDLGYEKNRDYFVVFYDWRDDNRESLENYLLPTLEEIKEISYDENFDIVAHSMGGFMTLDYLTGDDYENDIDKVVLQGSPLMGASKVYPAWEGGLIPEGWEILENYIKILSWEDENEGLDNYDIIHKYIPSAKQLMPIYDYIQKNDTGETVNYWAMEEQNDYLMELMQKIGMNQNGFDFGEDLLMIQGTGFGTSETIKVDEYQDENSEKLWKDGQPNPYPLLKENQAGDGTVLNFSSSALPSSETITLQDVKHNDLPAKAVQKTGDFLGINFTDKEYPETIKDKLLFIFACPIDVEISDSLGNVVNKNESQIDGAYYYSDGNDDGYKIVEIQNPDDQNYSIEIIGNGDGEYDGVIYQYTEDESISSEFNGEVIDGEEVAYEVNTSGSEIQIEENSTVIDDDDDEGSDEESDDGSNSTDEDNSDSGEDSEDEESSDQDSNGNDDDDDENTEDEDEEEDDDDDEEDENDEDEDEGSFARNKNNRNRKALNKLTQGSGVFNKNRAFKNRQDNKKQVSTKKVGNKNKKPRVAGETTKTKNYSWRGIIISGLFFGLVVTPVFSLRKIFDV